MSNILFYHCAIATNGGWINYDFSILQPGPIEWKHQIAREYIDDCCKGRHNLPAPHNCNPSSAHSPNLLDWVDV